MILKLFYNIVFFDVFTITLIAEVNTENEQALGAHFGIRSIPTLMIFREGIGIFSQAGTLSGKDLEDLLEKAKKLDMNEIRKEIKAKPSQ